MASHNELGKEGENAAVKYLLEKGYEIRHRNWHSGHRDLDIVAQKDGELVIVEVKTRSDACFGQPEDVANCVLAASSGLLDFGTGTVLNADGGFHIRRL